MEIHRYNPDFSSAQHISLGEPENKSLGLKDVATVGEYTYVSIGKGIIKFDEDFNQVEYRDFYRGSAQKSLFNFKDSLYCVNAHNQIVEIKEDFQVGKAVQFAQTIDQIFSTDDAVYINTTESHVSNITRLDSSLQKTATLTANLGAAVTVQASDGGIWMAGTNGKKLCVMKADSELDSRHIYDIDIDRREAVAPLAISLTADGNAMITSKIDEGYGVLVLNNAMEAVGGFTLSGGMEPALHYRDPAHKAWWTASRADLYRPVLFNDGFIYSDAAAHLRGPLLLDSVNIHTSTISSRTTATKYTTSPVTTLRTQEQEDYPLTITDLDMSGVLSA